MSLKRPLFFLLLTSLTWVGCISGAEGSPEDNDLIAFPEGGSLAADGGVDAGNPNEVRGTRVMHYRTDLADFTQPIDPLTSDIKAFTLSDGGTKPLTVQSNTTDGTFRVLDAPAGRYYLQMGTFYVVSDSRTLNLDRYDLGRRDPVLASSIALTLSASELEPQPYEDYPSWELVSSNLGLTASLAATSPVPANSTSVNQLPLSYTLAYPDLRLVNAARGDRLYINHFTDRNDGDFNIQTIDRFLTPPAVSWSASAPTDLKGKFQLPTQRTLNFSWWRSRFEVYQVQVHPQSTSSSQYLSVSPTAWGSDGWYGYVGDVLFLSPTVGITDLVSSVNYGDPYPYSWGKVVTIQHSFRTPTLLPGTTYGGVTDGLTDYRPLEAFTAGPITPRISPPWDVIVDGRNAQQEFTLSKLTPRITWKAPLLGTPSAYWVRISRLTVSGTRTMGTIVSTFQTKETSLDVPPNIFQLGQKYAVRVTAILTPGIDLTVQPYVDEVLMNQARASAVSSIISTPASVSPLSPEPTEETPLKPEPEINNLRAMLRGRE
jgi:hypothetical protein